MVPPVEHVAPPGLAVTVYAVIVAPPFEPGAVHVTATWVLPRVPLAPVGASGTVEGVTEADADEAALVPATLEAVTVNVYGVPFVRPDTVHPIVPPVEHVAPPGLAVT